MFHQGKLMQGPFILGRALGQNLANVSFLMQKLQTSRLTFSRIRVRVLAESYGRASLFFWHYVSVQVKGESFSSVCWIVHAPLSGLGSTAALLGS